MGDIRKRTTMDECRRTFQRLDEVRLRRLIWALLAVLGALGVGNAVWRLAG